jgi:hypothetical protein
MHLCTLYIYYSWVIRALLNILDIQSAKYIQERQSTENLIFVFRLG